MRASTLTVALAGMAAAAIAAAQATPPNSSATAPPPGSSRSAPPSMATPTSPSTGNYTNGSQDSQWQMKDCMARQKAKNPSLSQDQMIQNCRKQQPQNTTGQ